MIRVRDLSKVFRIPHMRKKTLFHNLLSVASGKYEYEEFFALGDVTFDVARGEFLGIIGRNGSGKSTLLKLISRIYQPTSGSVEVNDDIFPLLELGVGFQPDFSVRENIYLYGSLLGYSRREMRTRADDILEFAELGRFADSKLDKLSTGMQMRLGFSIAIQSVAPIMLVDEVLAVGDQVFAEKCRQVFYKMKHQGTTVVLVSHDLHVVQEFCTRVMILHNGRLMRAGDPSEVIAAYKGLIQSEVQG